MLLMGVKDLDSRVCSLEKHGVGEDGGETSISIGYAQQLLQARLVRTHVVRSGLEKPSSFLMNATSERGSHRWMPGSAGACC